MGIIKIFRKKSIATVASNISRAHELERSLGLFQLILLGIGAIIGAGIFVIIGPATGAHAGPAVTLSFIIAAFACACAGLCYAELASSLPVSGSAYSYLYVSLGEIVAWLVAGTICISYFMGAATVAGGWSAYFTNFLAGYDIYFPIELSSTTGREIELEDGTIVRCLIDLPAFLLCAMLTLVLYIGTGASAAVNSIIVFVKMAVLIGFIVVGVTKVNIDNWFPYIPENTGLYGEFGFSGILAGASLVIFAFAGFDVAAAAAQETKHPQRNVPLGILGSLFIATLTYVLIAAIMTGIVSYDLLDNGQPVAIAAEHMGMPWFENFIKIGAVIGLPSVTLAMLFGTIRVVYTVAKDGLLPKLLAHVHPKKHTPHIATFMIGMLAAVVSSTVSLTKLAEIANFGTAVTFIMVCVATIYLRYKHPDMHRAFRCPLVPLIPLLGIVLFMQIIIGLSMHTWILAGIMMSVLFIAYFAYSFKRSNLIHTHEVHHEVAK